MSKENPEGAFSNALAGESIPDGLSKYLYSEDGKFNEELHDLLLKFARTVAYKVYHNLRNGHEMDMTADPLEYVDCGSSSRTISHEEFNSLIATERNDWSKT